MRSDQTSPLVSTEWLSQHLNDDNLRIVDVRWRSRYENGRGISFDDHEGYLTAHIPGAVFVRMVGELSDPKHPIPDMLVQAEQCAEVIGRLGVGNDTLVIAYDNMGAPLGSARFWWALSYYGHDRVPTAGYASGETSNVQSRLKCRSFNPLFLCLIGERIGLQPNRTLSRRSAKRML